MTFDLAAPVLQAQPLEQATQTGSASPDALYRTVSELDAEFFEDAARIFNGARAIGRALVPGGRRSKDGPGIAAAQGAHHHIVLCRRVFDRHHVFALPA